MKKKNWAILLLTSVYSFLFYHQHAGINFLLYTLIFILLIISLSASLVKNKNWLFVAFFSLLSAIFVLIYGSSLAIVANMISILLLSALTIPNSSSIILNIFFSTYSILSSVVFIILSSIQKSKQPKEHSEKRNGYKILTVLIPIILSLIFLLMYKSANPLFADFTKEINLNFISIEWLFFSLAGFLIAYGLIFHKKIEPLEDLENTISDKNGSQINQTTKWDEKKAVTLLFVLLNIMLLVINALDVNYLYLGAGMPKGITHKEFVHDGVGMLILSLVLAISIILYYFRASNLKQEKNKIVKLLVYAWIFQNLLMVFSTSIRNHLYIEEALLTYKRIGVYYWLLLAAIGLITTFLKIVKEQLNRYIFRITSFIAYIILVLSAVLDWDKYISDYNISKIKYLSSLDKKYLISLSESNLAQLFALKNNVDFNTDSLYHYEYQYHYLNTAKLDAKLFDYLKNNETDTWKSFTLRKQRVLEEIKKLNAAEKITSLDLSMKDIYSLSPVFSIDNLKDLNLQNSSISKLNELEHFKKLEKLNLSGNYLLSLDSLPEMKKLSYLSLSNNQISDLKSLEKAPRLETLDLSENNLTHVSDLPILSELRELFLNHNNINDFSYLRRFPKLESLTLSNCSEYPDSVPELTSLKQLNISNSSSMQNILRINPPPHLEYLNLSSNNLNDLSLLTKSTNNSQQAIFENLKELNIDKNELYQLTNIHLFTKLEVLSAANNKLKQVDELSILKNLKKIYLNNNLLRNLSFLNSTTQLKELNIGYNNAIKDFKPIEALKNLAYLDVSGTNFNTISIINSNNLEELNLTDCKIQSFEKLEHLKKLKIVYVSYLNGKDLIYLKKMTHLKKLYVSKTNKTLYNQLADALRTTEVVMTQ